MKTCPNCAGDGRRNWEGDGIGQHDCRMCRGHGNILEPSDVSWLAHGWEARDGTWMASPEPPIPGVDTIDRCYRFSLSELMVLIAGANAVGGELTKAAKSEKGMVDAWRGVIVHPRQRSADDAA